MKESDIRDPAVHQRYLEMVRADAKEFFGDPGQLESVRCPACHSNQFDPAFRKFGFTYVTCPTCRTLYVNPRPKVQPLMDFYVQSASSRYWVEKFFMPVAEIRREKIFAPRARYVADRLPEIKGQKIGDIGAGFGLFLDELRLLWTSGNFVAIEPSPEMAGICRKLKLTVEESTIEMLPEHDGGFALLTAFELLEHLHDPGVMIAKAFQLLRPGGYFLATTLNGEGFDIQLLWENSRSVFPPHHLNFLNPESFSRLCRNAGFEVKAAETPGVLDWQIVEGALQRKEIQLDRFWGHLSEQGSPAAKSELQDWISRQGLSSHMRLLAQKPLR